MTRVPRGRAGRATSPRWTPPAPPRAPPSTSSACWPAWPRPAAPRLPGHQRPRLAGGRHPAERAHAEAALQRTRLGLNKSTAGTQPAGAGGRYLPHEPDRSGDVRFGDGSSGLDIKALSPEAQAALKKAGIDQGKLAAIAGQDGVIKGQDELDALFTLVDTKDKNGSYHSIATTTANGEATASGQLYEALKGEQERARLGGPAAGATKPAASDREPLGNAHHSGTTDAKYEAGVAALEGRGVHRHPHRQEHALLQPGGRTGVATVYPEGQREGLHSARIKEAGCAPTALAMADATLRGGGTLPADTAKFAVRSQAQRPAEGSAPTPTLWQGLGQGARPDLHAGDFEEPHQGEAQKENVDTIRDGLKNGGVAVVGVRRRVTSPTRPTSW